MKTRILWIIFLFGINANAQTNYCEIYNISLDSIYRREFGFFIDSLQEKSDLIDPVFPKIQKEMKNKKYIIENHFVYLRKTTVSFDEEYIQQWFNPTAIKSDRNRKHLKKLPIGNCGTVNDFEFKAVEYAEREELSKNIKSANGNILPVVEIYASDLIIYNNGREAILWITFYNPFLINNITGEDTFGIRTKFENGKWVIKECKINAGG